MQIICAGVDEVVVGLYLAGMSADENLQGFAVVMEMGATSAAGEDPVTMDTWGESSGDVNQSFIVNGCSLCRAAA
jgi:pyruvate/2-oxoglutarate dehydrogenase complex dihydrolipoamide dehydrogenase (E3) component